MLRLLGNVGILAVSLGLSLVAAEVFLRASPEPFPRAGWRTGVPPFEESDGMTPEALNQLGLRGKPFAYEDDDFVILLVGDSQVVARTQPSADRPELKLEHYANLLRTGSSPPVRVFSVAAPGWGQDQQLLMLRRYFEQFRADLVLVWVTWENDLYDITFPTNLGGHAKPTFWLEDGDLRGPNLDLDEEIEPWKLAALIRRAWMGDLDERWEKRLPASYRGPDEYEGPTDPSWQKLVDTGAFRGDLAREKFSGSISLEPRSPRAQYSLDLLRTLLGEMRAAVEKQGGTFGIFWVEYVAPGALDPRSLVSRLHTTARSPNPTVLEVDGSYYIMSQRAFESAKQSVAEGFNAWPIPIELANWSVSDVDRHLNSAANDLLMRRIARIVVARPSADPAASLEETSRWLDALFAKPMRRMPYRGRPFSLPGRIEFEDYDIGGQGVAYSDADAGNRGGAYRGDDVDIFGASGDARIGWIRPGEWLEYTIRIDRDVPTSFRFRVHAASPSPSGARIRFRLDGSDLAGAVHIPGGADWDDDREVVTDPIVLPPGQHVLRVEMEESFLALDYVDVVEVEGAVDDPDDPEPQRSGGDSLSDPGTPFER